MRGSQRDAEFAAFVREHRGPLLRMARLLTAGEEAGAEDLVQTALTRLYVRWPLVRRADHPVAYARRVLTRVHVDESRRAHRRREQSSEPVTDGRHLAGAEREPDDVETREAVLAALAELAPGQRAVVVLRHWCDLDVASAARVLGCSEGAVKSQNAKALAHLRERLIPTLEERP